jgi:hypothetical protein
MNAIKKLTLLGIVLLSSLAQAQSFTDQYDSSVKKIDLNLSEFRLSSTQEKSINGLMYDEIRLERVNQDFNAGLIATNLGINGLATYAVLSSKTNDKEKHFAAGYVIANFSSAAAYLLIPKENKNRKLYATLIGFLAATAVGGAKELYDARNPEQHTSDFKDFGATSLGGLAGAGMFTLTFNIFEAKNR